jgi:hypothetical protein
MKNPIAVANTAMKIGSVSDYGASYQGGVF